MFQSKKPNLSRGIRHVRKFRLRTRASRNTRVKYATTLRNRWTHYPPRYSNGWAEFWSEPIKLLVGKLNHAHWLRIIYLFFIYLFLFFSMQIPSVHCNLCLKPTCFLVRPQACNFNLNQSRIMALMQVS